MGQTDRKVVYSTDDVSEDDSPFAALRGQIGDDNLGASAGRSTPAPPSTKTSSRVQALKCVFSVSAKDAAAKLFQ